MSQVVSEYKIRLIIGYTIIAAVIALLAQNIYKDFFNSIIKLMFTEEYSYLIVSFLTVVFTLYLSLKYMGFTYEVQISRVLASLLLSVIAILLYFVAKVDLEHSINLMGLSFAILITSILILIFKPLTISDTIPLFVPVFMVPVPARLLDQLTPILSRFVGRIAAVITGVKLIESPGLTTLELSVDGKAYNFSVEAACTGIVTLSSILVVFPVLVYYMTSSRESSRRKVAIASLALFIGLMIGFIGNVLRVLLVILVARNYSVELAMNVFHYSPSAIYSAISVIVIYRVISKLSNISIIIPRPLRSHEKLLVIRWEYVAGIIVLLLLLVSTVHAIVTLAEINSNNKGTPLIEIEKLEDFVNNPVKYLIRKEVSLGNVIYDGFLTRVIGSIATYKVTLLRDSTIYAGFLELVDTPGRLHTLQLCITLQGYYIRNSWSEKLGSIQVTYIMSEKEGRTYLLGYILVPVIVTTSTNERYLFYVRMSLMRFYKTTGDIEELTNALLEVLNIDADVKQSISSNSQTIPILSTIATILFLTLLTYIVLMYVHAFASRKPGKGD